MAKRRVTNQPNDGIPTDENFRLKVRYEPRLITQHLGKDKYPRGTKTLTELVTNALR